MLKTKHDMEVMSQGQTARILSDAEIGIREAFCEGYDQGQRYGYNEGIEAEKLHSVAEYENGFLDGSEKAWRTAREILSVNNTKKVRELFDANPSYVLWNMCADDVISVWDKNKSTPKSDLKEIRKAQGRPEVEVGDEVVLKDDSGCRGVVTYSGSLHGNCIDVMLSDGSVCRNDDIKDWNLTGRHLTSISALLDDLAVMTEAEDEA